MNTEASSILSTVETPVAITTYYNFCGENIYFECLQKSRAATRIFDAFSQFWSIAYTHDLAPGKVYLKRHGELIPVFGNVGLFVPPFTILDWHVQGGEIPWKAIVMFGTCPDVAPALATVFPLRYELPFDRQGLNLSIFEKMGEGQIVSKEEKILPLSLKAKAAIDGYFDDPISLGQIAKEIGYTQSAISRAFKITYEISPIYYRNQLRIFNASLKLLRGSSVTQVGHEVGFQDLSRFNKQFRSRMKAMPRQFKTLKTI
jgi:AraC-like DNA-binding protein